ncbi:MAG: hypothetical protein QOK21_1937 [Solirubrobacteraceae bacterium]|nr:hypothetical protein [Solirubrobacteraceae bacterium]
MFGTLARKGIAWLILIAVAVILVKVAVGIVVGLISTLLLIALVGVLAYGAFWAYRRL